MSGRPLPGEFYDAALFGVHMAVGHMHLHVVLDLAEPFSRGQVVRAVQETVDALGILGCRYVPGWWRDRWEPQPRISADDVVEVVEGDADEALRALPLRPLDPTWDWPWRVSIMPCEHGQRLVVTLLHAVADGAGALAVTGELAARLAGRTGTGISGDRGFGQLLRSLRLRDLPHLLLGCLQEFGRPLLLPLLNKTALREVRPAPARARQAFRTVVVGVGQGSAVRTLCARVDCTVNDVLVASLALLNASLGPTALLGNYFTVDLRRYLTDAGPRVCNLSGVDSVILKRSAARNLETAARAVGRRTERMKRQAVGLTFATLPAVAFMALPHAVVRAFAAAWGRWTSRLLTRGLVVTNIGAMDRYVEPLGDNLLAASVLGPFGRGPPVPIITATGFRGRLTLQINGFDSIESDELDRVARELSEILGAVG